MSSGFNIDVTYILFFYYRQIYQLPEYQFGPSFPLDKDWSSAPWGRKNLISLTESSVLIIWSRPLASVWNDASKLKDELGKCCEYTLLWTGSLSAYQFLTAFLLGSCIKLRQSSVEVFFLVEFTGLSPNLFDCLRRKQGKSQAAVAKLPSVLSLIVLRDASQLTDSPLRACCRAPSLSNDRGNQNVGPASRWEVALTTGLPLQHL